MESDTETSRAGLALALRRGVDFLLARQDPDGLWREFMTPAGAASAWPSGVIGAALWAADAPVSPLLRCADALRAVQAADGAWGYNEAVPGDADSTACVLYFLARLGCEGPACQRAAACLATHQRRDGGIATYREAGPIRRYMRMARWVPFFGWCGSHTEVTAMAARAWHATAPDTWRRQVDAAWRHVRRRQRPDGLWDAYWWTSPHWSTWQAVELATALGDTAAARRAAESVARAAHPDAWSISLALAILARAETAMATQQACAHALVQMQAEDGGWPSASILRIPLPFIRQPERPARGSPVHIRGGIEVADTRRTYTTAACVHALALVAPATHLVRGV